MPLFRLIPILLFSLTLLNGCAQSSDKPTPITTPANQSAKSTSPDEITWLFSATASATGRGNAANWCRADFSEAVITYPEKEQPNRRYFQASIGGVYKINVASNNGTAACFVRPTSAGEVEIFTSDNYPECLSNRANYTRSDSGLFLDYDNQRGISFSLQGKKAGAATVITLELPPTAQYGLTVNRCQNCR